MHYSINHKACHSLGAGGKERAERVYDGLLIACLYTSGAHLAQLLRIELYLQSEHFQCLSRIARFEFAFRQNCVQIPARLALSSKLTFLICEVGLIFA